MNVRPAEWYQLDTMRGCQIYLLCFKPQSVMGCCQCLVAFYDDRYGASGQPSKEVAVFAQPDASGWGASVTNAAEDICREILKKHPTAKLFFESYFDRTFTNPRPDRVTFDQVIYQQAKHTVDWKPFDRLRMAELLGDEPVEMADYANSVELFEA